MEKEISISKLKNISRETCQKFKYSKVYFAKLLGKRLSFIAGWGEEIFTKPYKIALGDNIFVFIETEEIPDFLETEKYIRNLLDRIYTD